MITVNLSFCTTIKYIPCRYSYDARDDLKKPYDHSKYFILSYDFIAISLPHAANRPHAAQAEGLRVQALWYNIRFVAVKQNRK